MEEQADHRIRTLGGAGAREFPPRTAKHAPAAMASADRVHLLMCTNAAYLQHAAVCLVSLLSNNLDLMFDIVIVGRASEALDETKVRLSLARFTNQVLCFRKFAPPEDRLLPLNPRAHYTLDNWTRLWVQDFFPEQIERVLYLDSDIVITGSIAPLWRIDLDGALLGVVDIPGSDRGTSHLGLSADAGYFNSGVLLIDLTQWRQTRALETVLNYIEANPDKMMRDVDQEALNACFHHRKKRLDYKWNAIRPFFEEPSTLPLPLAEREKVRKAARIIHFNGSSKPWSYFCTHPRKTEYAKYLLLTEWWNFIPEDRTFWNRVRKAVSMILPDPLKLLLKWAANLVWRPRR